MVLSRPDVELDFEIKDDIEYYQIGDNESLPTPICDVIKWC